MYFECPCSNIYIVEYTNILKPRKYVNILIFSRHKIQIFNLTFEPFKNHFNQPNTHMTMFPRNFKMRQIEPQAC